MRVYESNGHMVRLHDVTDGDTAWLPTLLRLMVEFFPHCEKFLPSLEQHARQPVTAESRMVPHQWIVEVDGEVAGFYIFDYRPERNCGLSLFMGLYPQFRAVRSTVTSGWHFSCSTKASSRRARTPPASAGRCRRGWAAKSSCRRCANVTAFTILSSFPWYIMNQCSRTPGSR